MQNALQYLIFIKVIELLSYNFQMNKCNFLKLGRCYFQFWIKIMPNKGTEEMLYLLVRFLYLCIDKYTRSVARNVGTQGWGVKH